MQPGQREAQSLGPEWEGNAAVIQYAEKKRSCRKCCGGAAVQLEGVSIAEPKHKTPRHPEEGVTEAKIKNQQDLLLPGSQK